MNFLKAAGVVLGVALLAGCAPKVSPLGTLNASRADGTVTLGYKFEAMLGNADRYEPSFAGGLPKAAQSCKTWGYTGAVELDSDMYHVNCTRFNPNIGCLAATYSKVYQCSGDEPGKVTR